MLGSFVSALSGLNAAATAINVIGNDLANLNTTGYKGTTMSFEDVVAAVSTQSTNQVGSGVASLTFTNYRQGTIQTTGGAEDAAIQGDGFFIVRSAVPGSPPAPASALASDEFTRAGNFQVDQDGILTTATGDRVQGWPLNSATNTVDTTQPIGDVVIPVGHSKPAVATTAFNAALNLNSAAGPGSPFSVPINIYDSLGNSHVITATFTETAANTWSASIASSDPDIASIKGGGPFTFTFNPNGSLDTVTGTGTDTSGNISGISITYTSADGASSPQALSWTPWQTPPIAGPPPLPGVGLVTQFAQASASSAIAQNGAAAAQLTSVSITNGGSIVAQYSDGTEAAVAQLALASVRNPDSLISTGDNNYQLGESSAIPVVGAAGSGGRGQIVGGSLESSNVDIATEFTQLIIFQRSYSANARVITTSDQVTQETINLIQA